MTFAYYSRSGRLRPNAVADAGKGWAGIAYSAELVVQQRSGQAGGGGFGGGIEWQSLSINYQPASVGEAGWQAAITGLKNGAGPAARLCAK